MADLTDAELDRLVERNNRYIASLRGENELKCGNGMASFALEESTTAITTLRARIAELEVEVEVANDPSPYCPICGSCGEDGCCSAQRCLYSDDKLMARIAELEADRAEWIEVERLRIGKE
jgi:hypothetical protein